MYLHKDKPRTYRKGDPLFATTKPSASCSVEFRLNYKAHWSFTTMVENGHIQQYGTVRNAIPP
jgi:hypothetical protein